MIVGGAWDDDDDDDDSLHLLTLFGKSMPKFVVKYDSGA
jgi:hypothetical protein